MLNLIRRDLILQKWQLLIFIPFILFFIFMDSHPALIFLVASIYIPFNAYAYDEKAESNILLNSLPYTRKEIIASRYLGGVIFTLLAIGLTSGALVVFNKSFTITDIAIGAGLFFLFAALTFPLFYILKPGYIFSVVLIGFLVLAAAGPRLVIFLGENITIISNFILNLSETALYTGSAVIVITVYTVSWVSSTVIYQRKAF